MVEGRSPASLLRILRTCARAPWRIGNGRTNALPASLTALADARCEHTNLLSGRWIGRLVERSGLRTHHAGAHRSDAPASRKV